MPPIDEAGRARLKVENLLSVLGNFNDANVDGLIVSGDIAGPPMDEVLRRIGSPNPVLCRLRADLPTLDVRLRNRGAPQEYLEAARVYDEQFTTAEDLSIDTDGLAVQDVAAAIRRRTGDWLHRGRSTGTAAATRVLEPAVPPTVVLVCGPTAVGKSTVAWEVFRSSVAAGVRTAYLDLAQMGFVRGLNDGIPRTLEVKARNVGTCWRNFSKAGARRLVLSGEIDGESDLDAYRRSLGGAGSSVCALTASVEELTKRALMRGQGLATELPGDDLRGRSLTDLQEVARDAARRATILRRSTLPDLHLETDALTAAEIADKISSHAFP